MNRTGTGRSFAFCSFVVGGTGLFRSSTIELFGVLAFGGSELVGSSAHHHDAEPRFSARRCSDFKSANESARRIPCPLSEVFRKCLLLLLSILMAHTASSDRQPPDPIQPQPSPNCAAPCRMQQGRLDLRSPADSSDASAPPSLFDVPEPCSNAAGVPRGGQAHNLRASRPRGTMAAAEATAHEPNGCGRTHRPRVSRCRRALVFESGCWLLCSGQSCSRSN